MSTDTVSDTTGEQVLAQIDEQELVDLAVALGSIYSPTGHEGEACRYVYDWLGDEGFAPEKIGVFEERPNVVGRLHGTGHGQSLIFNSHLDTIMSRDDATMYANPDERVYHEAWVDDERRVWGFPVVNCKGPMACWMIAAKAIKASGVELRGDLLLTHVVGEIDQEPVDEYQGREFLAEDIGARYMISHGAIADFALVAEATSFKPGWVEAGKVFFKITVTAGPSRYTPYVEHPASTADSTNAVVQMARFVECFEDWARHYEERYTRDYAGGRVIPKASIGAVRAGRPYKIYRQPELCSLYVDIRLNPDTDPLGVEAELRQLVEDCGVQAEIKPFLYRRGYEAQGIEPLVSAVEAAHKQVLPEPPGRPGSPEVSMWRDTNPFNELGIPSLTYGPGAGAGGGNQFFTIDELVAGTKIYALTALDICNRERPARGPR
jgi:acetylornithine deacetylase/succinyl-diaminopimelate desuccinylase-like protein